MTHESARLTALRALHLLDTPPAESFERITRLAAQIFALPIAAISLTDTDRQWFKSRVGVEHWQIPRELAPCGEVSDRCAPLIVEDLGTDKKYKNSFLAKSGIRFYAGAPLTTRDGYTLGAMCVLGHTPRQVSAQEMQALRDLAAMVMAQIELQHAFGRVDPSTGLPNAYQMMDDIEDATRDADGQERVAVFVDLLPAQQFSDALRVLGPAYVDELGRSAAQRLHEALPHVKHYHIDSTHFGFVLDTFNLKDLSPLAELVQAGLVYDKSRGIHLALRPVLGMAPFRLGAMSPRDVLRIARSAAQDARNLDVPFAVYSDGEDQAHRRSFALLNDLKGALASHDQLQLVFQPRVDLKHNQCIGAEALIRWKHPSLGNVPPSEFIGISEQGGMARAVTDWVLDAAIFQIAKWERAGRDLTISVNISARNLDEGDFAQRVLQKIACSGVRVSSLELELTESALIRNGARAIQQLNALKAAGIKIAVDDFGTGYSSLAYLQQIPAHCVKIDRAFVQAMTGSGDGLQLVYSMIKMLHDLHFRVVAEGVENGQTCELLKAGGCDEGQGYYYAKPLPPYELEIWLDRRQYTLSIAS